MGGVNPWRSALYDGVVTHERFAPRVHALRYRIFMMLADLDELDALDQSLRLFSHNRFNLLSFHDADYGDRSGAPLRPQVEAHLAAGGIEAGGAIRLLCLPRVLGYVFNPLSLYFCHRPDGALAAILYEVSNTFGDRHSYLIPVTGEGPVRQACDKALYVSPFMDMDLAYAFKVVPPGEAVSVQIEVTGKDGRLLSAAFAGDRRPISDAALLRAWASHPLLTAKVVAGIHWEALILWLKGMKLRQRPAAPSAPVSFVSSAKT